MTHMSLQNMNGVGILMRRRISRNQRLTLSDIVPPDQTPITDDDLGLDPKGLSPNYAPWWTQPPLRPGEVSTQRGTPTPGETRQADSAYWPSSPLTPSNDARDLPESYTGKPLRQLPRHDYPGVFPHTWTPYEDLHTSTGPEMGPTLPGWAPTPTAEDLRKRAVDGGQPVPWVAEDQMTHDISGFASLQDLGRPRWRGGMSHADIHARVVKAMARHAVRGMAGLGQIPGMVATDAQLEAQIAADAAAGGQTGAAASAVTNQAAAAQAAGATPSVVDSIISGGSKVAVSILQAKGVLPAAKPASVLPGGASMTPVLIGVGAVGVLGAIWYAATRKGGRRR